MDPMRVDKCLETERGKARDPQRSRAQNILLAVTLSVSGQMNEVSTYNFGQESGVYSLGKLPVLMKFAF